MRQEFWVQRHCLSIALLLSLLLPSTLRAQSGSASDEKQIRDVEAKWDSAWNHHDVAAMVRLGMTGADYVNLAGEWFMADRVFAGHQDCPAGDGKSDRRSPCKFRSVNLS
jgi:hypothetical protein